MDFNDELDQKPIHLAAQNDHTNVVKKFLEIRPSLVSSTTKDGNTLAHLAAKKGSVDVLQVKSRVKEEYIFPLCRLISLPSLVSLVWFCK